MQLLMLKLLKIIVLSILLIGILVVCSTVFVIGPLIVILLICLNTASASF